MTNINNNGFDLTKTTIFGNENVILNENSLTFIETSDSTIPPSIVSTNSLTQGQLRLEALLGVLEIQTNDILINGSGGSNGFYLGYSSGLDWIKPTQSGTIAWLSLPSPITSGTVTFSNSYFQVNPPKVFLTFNNYSITTFVNVAVTGINPGPINPQEWVSFDWAMSVDSDSLPNMSISWLSVA